MIFLFLRLIPEPEDRRQTASVEQLRPQAVPACLVALTSEVMRTTEPRRAREKSVTEKRQGQKIYHPFVNKYFVALFGEFACRRHSNTKPSNNNAYIFLLMMIDAVRAGPVNHGDCVVSSFTRNLCDNAWEGAAHLLLLCSFIIIISVCFTFLYGRRSALWGSAAYAYFFFFARAEQASRVCLRLESCTHT